MKNSTLIMFLPKDATGEEIIEQMRFMKSARESESYQHIVLLIDGYNNDPRELWEIPEVRPVCRRLVEMGYISFLEVLSSAPSSPKHVRFGLGAGEVWLIAEGKFHCPLEITRSLLDRVMEILSVSNERAVEVVGVPQLKETTS